MIVISLKSTVDTVKKQYNLRSQTIERRFGDIKEQHGMGWMRFRRHDKISMDTTLICVAMNLQNMEIWLVKWPIMVWNTTTILKKTI